jgi:hypothetical protein
MLRRQRDQRAGGDGAPVHVRNSRHFGAEQRVADLHRGVHAPAERVDLQHHGRRAGRGRFVENALHEGREAQVDDAFDGCYVDQRRRRPPLLPEGRRERPRQCERHKR